MMITQLQHQDPTAPASNEELMAQMSQIGQLQASTQLQQTLTSLAIQNQIGSAGNLIGKMVQGLDDNKQTVSGVVTSVSVQQNQCYLNLDTGNTLSLGNVTSIAPATTAVAATTN